MMENKVLNFIKENKMIKAGETVVVGVSGGADSVCLLHMLSKYRKLFDIKLLAVHIHHGIRGESADRDAAFVEEICGREDIPFFLYKYNIPALAKEKGMSEEEAGRYARYEAFSKCLSENCGASNGKIAVAHNKDDLAETMLFNLFRGAGVKGLKGITAIRDNIIRPVLCLERREIEEYIRINDLKYIVDETNLTEDYTRNKIRLNIMPQIKEAINSQAVAHMEATAANLTEIDDYMESQCEKEMARIVKLRGQGVFIDGEGLENIHKALQRYIVKKCIYQVAGKAKDISSVHINSVMELFYMTVGKKVSLPYEMTAVKEYDGVHIYISREDNSTERNETLVIDIDAAGEYTFADGKVEACLKVEEDSYNESIFVENKYTKWIQCDIMKVNLQLRTRRQGDYIVVDEKGSKKKLKDFFIDIKVPKEQRDDILLLANGSEIVWIIGYRLNYRYRVRDEHTKLYKLETKVNY